MWWRSATRITSGRGSSRPLDDGGHAGLGRLLDSVREGEEGVRSHHAAGRPVAGLADGDVDRVDSAGLAGTRRPTSARPLARTTAFELTCLTARQANSRPVSSEGLAGDG